MSPLDGINVVDCSALSPGPYCTQLLADLGADVVLVERPPAPGEHDDAAFAELSSLRRGKRSIVVDLKDSAGVEVVRTLVAGADVFVEGWRPGVAARLGLGYDDLVAAHPSLVYCSVTGFGQAGPNARLAGHDLNYLAMCGMLSTVSYDDHGPVPPLNLLADYAGGGLAAAFAIMVALFLQATTGERVGHLDVSMADSVLSFMGPHVSRLGIDGGFPERGAHRLAGRQPHYRSYECLDGEWISVAAIEPRFWDALCAGAGVPELAGRADDGDSSGEITATMERVFRTATRAEWFERLRDVTCVAPVLNITELASAPEMGGAHRLLSTATASGTTSTWQPAGLPGFPARMTDRPPVGPLPGADTADVLASLGYDQPTVVRHLAAWNAPVAATSHAQERNTR